MKNRTCSAKNILIVIEQVHTKFKGDNHSPYNLCNYFHIQCILRYDFFIGKHWGN
jgi:hypothetical protein